MQGTVTECEGGWGKGKEMKETPHLQNCKMENKNKIKRRNIFLM